MMALKDIGRTILSRNVQLVNFVPVAGLQSVVIPTEEPCVEAPARRRLRVVPKNPLQDMPPNIRPMKMQKKLRLMRGPETVHNTLLHEQFGVIATTGGRLKFEHFEMMRMHLVRNINFNKVFAVWRVDPPWQPCTKKSQGMRMGGGKGSIAFYVTPIKAGRVILEVAGNCEYFEVQKALENIAGRLPLGAKAVTHEQMLKEAEEEKWREENNLNPYTWKYIIQNNMLGYRKYASRYEKRWFNKYV